MFNLLKAKEEKKAVPHPAQGDMTLEEVRVSMLRLMAEESGNHHRMGALYNYVVERKLAEAAGYKNAQEYFGQNLRDLSQSALSMYGAVARTFSEAVSSHFGVTCLYLLLIYKEAADLEVNPEAPGGTLIEVPGAKGEVMSKLFSQCTVEEMRKAIQRKRKPSSSKPVPAEDLALADRYLGAVTNGLPKGDSLQVQVRNHKGKTVLDFRGIPLTQVKQLVDALSAHVPPGAGGQGAEKTPYVP
jgi:hypothetical protein